MPFPAVGECILSTFLFPDANSTSLGGSPQLGELFCKDDALIFFQSDLTVDKKDGSDSFSVLLLFLLVAYLSQVAG